ncbi:MAG: hypothetical protein JWL97_4454, partial [Gemmatimonadales bacterium]|nr:hypothetical protein [Gemmatimonadales bacterium]
DQLDQAAERLVEKAAVVAEVDAIIAEGRPLRPFFSGQQPWGARAHGSDRAEFGKRLSTVLSHWQINHLAADMAADMGMPWRDEQPGISYLDGIEGLPGLEVWESPRAARRRAAERQAAIAVQTLREPCSSCTAAPGNPCMTNGGRLAETPHRPRVTAATRVIDGAGEGAQ